MVRELKDLFCKLYVFLLLVQRWINDYYRNSFQLGKETLRIPYFADGFFTAEP